MIQGHENNLQILPPYKEIVSLASCCEDDYYRVVVTDMGGTSAILNVMRIFLHDENIQAWCCIAIGNLCNKSHNNQVSVMNLNGLTHIITAMRNSPVSVLVQNASVDALAKATSLNEVSVQALKDTPDFESLLLEVPDKILSVTAKMNKETLLERLQIAR